MLFKNEESKVLIAYIAVCILWGSTYLAMRIGVSAFPPELFAGLRFFTAGTIILIFALFRKLEFPSDLKSIRNQSIVGLIMLLGSNGLVIWAEQFIQSGVASLIVATSPLFMAVIELFMPGRLRMDFKGWIGLLIGFSGVAILVLSNSGKSNVDVNGIIAILIASFLWSAGSVYSKDLKPTGSMIVNLGIQMLAGGISLLIVGTLLGELPRVNFSAKAIGAMIYLIVFGSLIGYSCYIYILHKWPAAKAGTHAYVNPLVAVILGALVLDEPFTFTVLLSTIVILSGVLLVQVSKTKNESKTVIKKNDSSM